MEFKSAKYSHKDQSWENEQTIYWFTLQTYSFGNQIFGIVESSNDIHVIDKNHEYVSPWLEKSIIKACPITDSMRIDQ